jgi:hypothetical protein
MSNSPSDSEIIQENGNSFIRDINKGKTHSHIGKEVQKLI